VAKILFTGKIAYCQYFLGNKGQPAAGFASFQNTNFSLMAKIIFLNGCASAGKTTLAKEIQNLSEEK
jgi:hypothetical protein